MVRGAAAPFEDAVLLAIVVGAHGLKGEVKVRTFTEAASSLAAYGPLTADNGRVFEVVGLRATKSGEAVVKLAGIEDRDVAEAVKGRKLFVPRAALPPPDAEEFYHTDLIGLSAEDAAGKHLGTVRGIHNFGAGDVVEIEHEGGATGYVPFTGEAVPVVDLAGRRMVVAAPLEME